MSTGRLLIGATPLGQPTDASARLVSALGSADVIAAEDTRRIRTLAQALDVKPAGKVVSLYDQNEATRVPGLVAEIAAGATVLLVSDAGMPLISDPGYRLVSACIDAGAAVQCLPGPSAVTTALAVSGLPVGEVLLRGVRPAQALGADVVARHPDLRVAHVCVLRVAAPVGRHARGRRRGAGFRPRGRRLPGTDEDPRGDRPRVAGRAGRVGEGRRARRDHRRAGRGDADSRRGDAGGRGDRARRAGHAGQGRVRPGDRPTSGRAVAARALRCGSALTATERVPATDADQ